MQPYPQPHQQQGDRPNPDLLHLVTWPALVLAAMALLVAATTPPAGYPVTLAVGGAAVAATVPALLVGVRRQHSVLVVTIISLALGLVAVGIGIADMSEVQSALRDLRDTVNGLPF